jgi:RNA polymerase sigma factor for flagellar operon FliA
MTFRSPSIVLPTPAAPAWNESPRQLLLDALPIVDRVVRDLGRRYQLSRDEREELAGDVHVRLIDGDYAVLRQFQGRSRLSTYLRTVITRQFLDARVKAWGRWHPSVVAQRLGPTAVRLERLLVRHRLPLDQAIATLRSRGETADEAHLHAIVERLPRRLPRTRRVEATVLERVAAAEPSPEQALADERDAAARAVANAALRRATAALTAREQLLLRLRYEQGATVAEIARMLGEEQKPLYRHLERVLVRLRCALEAGGHRSST